MCTCSGSAI